MDLKVYVPKNYKNALQFEFLLHKEHIKKTVKISRKGIKTELTELVQYCSQASKIRYRKYKQTALGDDSPVSKKGASFVKAQLT